MLSFAHGRSLTETRHFGGIGRAEIDGRRRDGKVDEAFRTGILEAVHVAFAEADGVALAERFHCGPLQQKSGIPTQRHPDLLGVRMRVPRLRGTRQYGHARDGQPCRARVLGKEQLLGPYA